VANPRADEWSRDCHLRHLAERVAIPSNIAATQTEPNSEVWTNLANALALQATDRAGAAASGKKKQGFEAFPVTTRRLILVASEREEDGQMRLVPVESYVEILELGNAAHVRHHLHHHLHEDLGLESITCVGERLLIMSFCVLHQQFLNTGLHEGPLLIHYVQLPLNFSPLSLSSSRCIVPMQGFISIGPPLFP
jgi:hypothetical protein